MLNNVIEAVGYLLLVAFLWFVWPPLVLVGAGALLVVGANVRAGRRLVPAKKATEDGPNLRRVA